MKPWGRFHAKKDPALFRRYLKAVAEEAKKAFVSGMRSSKRVGKHSAPGDWPAVQSGSLLGSIQTRITNNSAEIGTNMPYSRFLRDGTRRMARRKMSDDAMKAGLKAANRRLGEWVQWTRG